MTTRPLTQKRLLAEMRTDDDGATRIDRLTLLEHGAPSEFVPADSPLEVVDLREAVKLAESHLDEANRKLVAAAARVEELKGEVTLRNDRMAAIADLVSITDHQPLVHGDKNRGSTYGLVLEVLAERDALKVEVDQWLAEASAMRKTLGVTDDLLTNVAAARRLVKTVGSLSLELEFCANTFASMTGSGPAHAARIRNALAEAQVPVPDSPTNQGGTGTSPVSEKTTGKVKVTLAGKELEADPNYQLLMRPLGERWFDWEAGFRAGAHSQQDANERIEEAWKQFEKDPDHVEARTNVEAPEFVKIPVGLYGKFNVTRTDGKSEPGQRHHNCDYFVLDLSHDPHALPAIAAYANDCRDRFPKLAEDLTELYVLPHMHRTEAARECGEFVEKGTLEVTMVDESEIRALVEGPPNHITVTLDEPDLIEGVDLVENPTGLPVARLTRQPAGIEGAILLDAQALATKMHEKFGPHDSADFACNRIAEEVGELIQAATAMSKGRDVGRAPRIREEAIDAVAMILRLLREYPDGRVAQGGQA